MRELKKAFKLMKYTYHYQSKDEKYMPLILSVVGMLGLLGCIKDAFFLTVASPMLVLSIAYVGSYYYSLPYAHMVGASGLRKHLELMIPNVLMVAGSLWGYLLIMIVLTISAHFNPNMAMEYAKGLVETSFMTGILIVFYGVSNKHYWIGFVIVDILIFVYLVVVPTMLKDTDTFLGRPLDLHWGLIIYGLALVVATTLSCLLRTLLYKKPGMRGRVGKQMLHTM